MEDKPSAAPDAGNTGAPEPEVLKPRVDDAAPVAAAQAAKLPAPEEAAKRRRRTYRPSHKATFIALAVVVAILAINAVILGFVLKNKADEKANSGQVTISADVLNKVGINKTELGNSGVQLTVDPDALFNGKVTVAGDVTVTGQFKLSNKLNAGEIAATKLEAGDTSLTQLNVSGKSTLSDLVLRTGLTVAGTTLLQGPVTVSQLLTVNNNLNVLGNLSVGGVFTAATFSANNLTSTSTLTIGGHIITAGSAPNVGAGTTGAGGALGSNGTVSINGNDTAGRIVINIGASAGSGTLANVAFHTQYGSLPRVVITLVIGGFSAPTCSFYVANLSVGGFSIVDTCNMPIGGFALDYIVMQ